MKKKDAARSLALKVSLNSFLIILLFNALPIQKVIANLSRGEEMPAELLDAIRSQTSSQQEHNETIRVSVENLVNVSAEINQSADEQSKGNHSILYSVHELLQNASRNTEVVKSLNEILGGFTDSQGAES